MADVPSQLDELEARASIAVLSVGGNDALEHIDVLESRQIRSDELLHRLVRIADDFEKRYFTTARTCVLSLTASRRTDRIYLRERLAFAALHVHKRMLDRFTVSCQNELRSFDASRPGYAASVCVAFRREAFI